MSNSVTLNGVSYLIPDVGEGGWGEAVTDYLVALSTGVLQKAGGTFTLTANVDFGASFGLRTLYYTTRTANLASAGQFRMARADVVNWRNQADSANLSLGVNSSDELTWGGVALALGTGTATVALDNLAAVAINTSLVSDTDNTDDLGTDAIEWKDLWVHTITHNDATNTDLTITTTGNDGNIQITPNGEGQVHVNGRYDQQFTAAMASDHALEIECDAAGYGDVKALDIDYTTGALAAGDEEACILVNIDESLATGGEIYALEVLATEGSAEVFGMATGAGVGVIDQHVGTFGDMDSALVNSTDRLAEFTSAGSDIVFFVADNDTVTIGNAAAFSEIEFLLDTVASKNCQITFEFSTGSGTWTSFTPTDGTNGMLNSGVIAWEVSNIPTWAPGLASEYLIKMTRTRNGSITSPIEDLVQIVETRKFQWTKDAEIEVLELRVRDADTHYAGLKANTTMAANNVYEFPAAFPGSTVGLKCTNAGVWTWENQTATDVGLGNVDNTSDATKNAAVATLTNKTLTSPVVNTGISGTAVLDEDDMSTDSDTQIATQQSIKAYSDSATQTMTNKTLTSPVLNTGVSGTAFLDEDNMASDSATQLASQQSIKAYADTVSKLGYDAIVDAAGNWDYTSIYTAVNTEAAGARILILDGAYAESTSIAVKETMQLIGQSKDGVVITFNNGSSASAFTFTALTVNRNSVRDADNGGWSTTGVGIATTTQGSVTVTHDGAGNVTAGNVICFGGNDYYTIATAGSGTFTLDDSFKQQSGTYDVTAFDAPVSVETPTVVENFTLICDNTSNDCFDLSSAYNVRISNLKLDPSHTGITAFYTPNANRIYVDRVEFTRSDSTNVVGQFIEVRGRMDNCHFTNIEAVLNDCDLRGDTGNLYPIKHCTFHFLRADGQYTNPMLEAPALLVDCHLDIELLTGGTAFSENVQATYVDWYGCTFKFGRADFSNASVSSDFNAAACIFELGNWTGSVDILDAASIAETNMIHSGRLSGTLVSDGNNILASSCEVGTLSGSVAARQVKGQAFSATNTLTDAATIATDCNLGNVHEVTLTANRTLGAPTNLKDGATYIWVITQDGGGTNTLAYNAVFKFPGGTAPTLSTGGGDVDILSGWSDGTNIYASLQEDFS